jgi:hypothetical protein
MGIEKLDLGQKNRSTGAADFAIQQLVNNAIASTKGTSDQRCRLRRNYRLSAAGADFGAKSSPGHAFCAAVAACHLFLVRRKLMA